MGTNPETSLHAFCQGIFGHNSLSSLSHCGMIVAYLTSGISVRELIPTSTTNNDKKAQAGPNVLAKSSQAGKKTPPPCPLAGRHSNQSDFITYLSLDARCSAHFCACSDRSLANDRVGTVCKARFELWAFRQSC